VWWHCCPDPHHEGLRVVYRVFYWKYTVYLVCVYSSLLAKKISETRKERKRLKKERKTEIKRFSRHLSLHHFKNKIFFSHAGTEVRQPCVRVCGGGWPLDGFVFGKFLNDSICWFLLISWNKVHCHVHGSLTIELVLSFSGLANWDHGDFWCSFAPIEQRRAREISDWDQ